MCNLHSLTKGQSAIRDLFRAKHDRAGNPATSNMWLEAETADALTLQRPLPNDALRIVASGERADGAPTSVQAL